MEGEEKEREAAASLSSKLASPHQNCAQRATAPPPILQPAPYDALVDDGRLPPAALAAARAAASTWLADGAYPLLAYSAIVLESVAAGGAAGAA